MTIVRSPRAVDDLFAIWSYIYDHDEAAADRLIERIEAKLSRLESFPGLGARRSAGDTDMRSVAIGRYILWYRALPDGVELVRVLHASRDASRLTFD
ncbi:hypothetical protein ASG29_07615 [Sphingomonas sp. Leaf412]|uniref:type II toxin-antitoxin system RelE/ParE family toxin n=1 Tax=Sphingomonas sp. Leaf412 TaxID=1736370 RepID=UPI0006FEF27E|nr:type II toxin-antitoxin system RelE/ParE family toxin [Sphingomonas sp. Leaf412]KQT31774.1 hypothetical protein ASG29_07615 [Sphingomonas sp. Leaf412]